MSGASESMAVDVPASEPQRRGRSLRWGSLWRAVWKTGIGVLLVQSPLGAILVLGWTYRLMQRTALREWSKQVDRKGASFTELVEHSPYRGHRVWPNWIVGHQPPECSRATEEVSLWRRTHGWAAFLTESFRVNLRVGAAAILNIWLLTLPSGLLWLFSWYDGWNNSFNKGYEQAAVGPALGVVGILLFIGAMFYLPMAQARQAVAGSWRAFYEFRLVWKLIRQNWVSCLVLAALYTVLSLPITVLKTVPAFLPQMNPALESLSPAEAERYLNTYFLWAGLIFFPAFVALRYAAARFYSMALLRGIRGGSVSEDTLSEREWHALNDLGLLTVQPAHPRHPVLRAVAWTGRRAGAIMVPVMVAMVWFSFIAQIYVSEFLLYHPKRGFLNQPLVQLPWFHY